MVPFAADGNREVTTKREAEILREVFLALGSRPDVRIFRNTVGVAWTGTIVERTPKRIVIDNPRAVAHGLAKGSSDLVGWQSRIITPEDVGTRRAIFIGCELKSAQGRLMDAQSAFCQILDRHGGIAIVARSPGEALEYLDRGSPRGE
jgi:hypothetical protein